MRSGGDLEHQGVDLVDHLGSRPQVRFFEAVERRIHQIVHFGQRWLVGLDVDQAGGQPVVLPALLRARAWLRSGRWGCNPYRDFSG